VIDFAGAGLGLQHGSVRLVRSNAGWESIARDLIEDMREAVVCSIQAVEHIGSTAVPGLLAKPIIDLAIGVDPGVNVPEIAEPMSQLGWIYRGDAGDDGGWVFVMEDAPWHRVAHAHGVEFGGPQWIRYLEFRELLRQSPAARRAYEATKERLATEHPDGRDRYTAGKTATVQRLLAGEK
jgi:GrpB-like predicted nucleotidyltransferase (UPF0157 family)